MEFILKEYVEKIREKDIKNYALKEGINLNDDEVKIIYMYIKNYWQVFYKGNPEELFLELKSKLSENAYNKIIELYIEYKRK